MDEVTKKQKTIFIVGGAGYVGEMLCDQFSKNSEIDEIIVLDKEEKTSFLKENKKITWITSNMADDGWQEIVRAKKPEIVIHTAWQIRAMYGKSKEQWRWNVDGSDKIFDFVFTTPSVKKLIYFSTASSYSARSDNTIEHLFTEKEGFRDDNYIYAYEKKQVEDNLKRRFESEKQLAKELPQIFVVRPAAITGPRGRYMRIRFGLQSALSGNLKGGFIYKVVTLLTSFVPVTKKWARQFIHEDDVSDAVSLLTLSVVEGEYSVFNLTPEGNPVLADDMAGAVEKKKFFIHPFIIKIAFFFFWHITRGGIPTCKGSWRFYSYPVVMDGSKLKSVYSCKYTAQDAFQYTDGRYENFVPKGEIKRSNN